MHGGHCTNLFSSIGLVAIEEFLGSYAQPSDRVCGHLCNANTLPKIIDLKVYDAMAEAMRTGRAYETMLSPQPVSERGA